MKKMFMAALIAVMAISVGVSNAEAKRLGSGSSFGKQSQSVQRSAPMQSSPAPAASQAANAPRPTPPAVAPKPASPWKGILGGALLGLGLGALFSHLGIGGALASMISTMLMIGLLALAAMFIYRMLRRKSGANEPTPAFAGAAANRGDYEMSQSRTPEIGSGIGAAQPAMLRTDSGAYGEQPGNEAPWGVPADFDSAGFLRHAKTYFIRLQAAWDKADLNDIREFTTPEMYSEIRMQISERGATSNHTDVVSLDAQLLGIETSGNNHLASVKFSGMIRESENAPAEPFAEVWNLGKPVTGQGGWTLAGIQQLS